MAKSLTSVARELIAEATKKDPHSIVSVGQVGKALHAKTSNGKIFRINPVATGNKIPSLGHVLDPAEHEEVKATKESVETELDEASDHETAYHNAMDKHTAAYEKGNYDAGDRHASAAEAHAASHFKKTGKKIYDPGYTGNSPNITPHKTLGEEIMLDGLVEQVEFIEEEYDDHKDASAALQRHQKRHPSGKFSVIKGKASGKYHVVRHTSGGMSTVREETELEEAAVHHIISNIQYVQDQIKKEKEAPGPDHPLRKRLDSLHRDLKKATRAIDRKMYGGRNESVEAGAQIDEAKALGGGYRHGGEKPSGGAEYSDIAYATMTKDHASKLGIHTHTQEGEYGKTHHIVGDDGHHYSVYQRDYDPKRKVHHVAVRTLSPKGSGLKPNKDKTEALAKHLSNIKEEVENLDLTEISANKLHKYIQKSAQQAGIHAALSKEPNNEYSKRKLKKRLAGITTAVNKLTKEDIDFVGDIFDLLEASMTDDQLARREELIKGMKKNAEDFKKKYGEDWEGVMYATATKQAMKEETELDEAVESGNKGYGYHGQHEDDADKKFSVMHGKVKKIAAEAGHLRDAKKPNVMVKHYLDSRHGRHLADVEKGSHLNPDLHSYIKKDFARFKKDYDPSLHEDASSKTKEEVIVDKDGNKRKVRKSTHMESLKAIIKEARGEK